MDPHFNEYLAVIAALQELYGDRCDEQPTEFHDEHDGGVADSIVPAAVAS